MGLFGGKKTFLDEGKRYLDLMLNEEALRQMAKSIEKRENLPEAYYYSAAAYFMKTDMESTKKYLRMLIELNPGDKLIRMICDLTGMKKLVSDKYKNSFPDFSFDGKKIVFASNRRKIESSIVDNNSGIYVVDIMSGEETRVVSDEYDNYHPSFSPDSKKSGIPEQKE